MGKRRGNAYKCESYPNRTIDVEPSLASGIDQAPCRCTGSAAGAWASSWSGSRASGLWSAWLVLRDQVEVIHLHASMPSPRATPNQTREPGQDDRTTPTAGPWAASCSTKRTDTEPGTPAPGTSPPPYPLPPTNPLRNPAREHAFYRGQSVKSPSFPPKQAHSSPKIRPFPQSNPKFHSFRHKTFSGFFSPGHFLVKI